MGLIAWLAGKCGLGDGLGNLAWSPEAIPDQSGKVYIITGEQEGNAVCPEQEFWTGSHRAAAWRAAIS